MIFPIGFKQEHKSQKPIVTNTLKVNEIVSISEMFKDVYPEFDGAITGIIKNISELSIGASIIYMLIILLFLALVINIVLNKFDFDKSKKQKILIAFCLLFAVGAAVTKYEMNGIYNLDLLRIKVFTHMHEEMQNKTSYPSLIKNINNCSEDKLNKLSSKYVRTFRRTYDESSSQYYINLISQKTLDLLQEKSLHIAKEFLTKNSGMTVAELRSEATEKGFVKIDSNFISAFLEKYPDWMIDESSGDSVLIKRPPPRLEDLEQKASISYDKVVETKGPKNSGY